MGPPAAGKSNILDAVSFAGYFNRLLLIDKEYENDYYDLEPLNVTSRYEEPKSLFRDFNIAEEVKILIKDSSITQDLSLKYEKGQPKLSINDIAIPWNLNKYELHSSLPRVVNTLKMFTKNLIDSRLYGFDRYGLAISECSSDTLCGFSYKARGRLKKSHPVNILSELAWNFVRIPQLSKRSIVNRINEELLENLEEKIELKVGREGDVVIYDYDLESETSATSDSIYRMLYYLAALETAIIYAKIHGLEKRLIVGLEEPEAHIFPFLFKPLVDWIRKAKDNVYIIISTHNPLFVSLIWDRFEDAKTYYVYRDKKSGKTNVVELDIEKFAKDLRTTDDLVELRPSEMIRNYERAKKETEIR